MAGWAQTATAMRSGWRRGRHAIVKRTLVREVMTTTVVTASEAMPFRHLVALMHARDIGAVPVTGPERHVLGVVSNADLAGRPAGLSAARATPPLVHAPRRRAHRRTTAG